MFFLDEVELALHPSSLKKLMTLLTQVSDEYILCYIFFHSFHRINSRNKTGEYILYRAPF